MSEASAAFLRRFIASLLIGAGQNPVSNHDEARYPRTAATIRRQRWRERLLELAGRFGWHRQRFNPRSVERELDKLLPHLDGFARSFARWADEDSRDLMIELLRYRVLGPEHAKLSTNTPAYWQQREMAACKYLRRPGVARVGNFDLDEFEMPGVDGPIRTIQRLPGATTTFLLKQYSLSRGNADIAPAHGDVVLDCGGCWGDTALYFADRVGPDGRVFTFEFEPANLAIFRQNLDGNPHLAPRIELVKRPVWSRSGETIHFDSAGQGTAIVSGGGSDEAATLSIDDLVTQRGLDRIDFIKMDIEGAELPALMGAERSLRRFRPKLAICAYHKIDDFITISDFIESLGCGYRIWLAHYTIHLEESVIFAECNWGKPGPAI